jgi:hypothetical protein
MTDCTGTQVFKNGVCIAQQLGKCKGCEEEFFKDLSEAGFKGLRINSDRIKPFGVKK